MSDEYVRLAAFESESKAILVQAVLQDNDIDVTMSGNEPDMLGLALDGPDTIEIFVRKKDLKQSQALMEQVSAEGDEGDEIPPWSCECGEDVDEGFFVCWSCGAEYKAGSEREPNEDDESE